MPQEGTAAQGSEGTATQPPAGGQGQGAPSQATGDAKTGQGFWDLFPDVPEEQRTLLEPHLKQVQGHVTKLEQDHAPYKELASNGVTPEGIQELVSFNQAFNQNPPGVWLAMARQMQEQGTLSPDLDVDEIEAVLSGRSSDGEAQGGEGEGGEDGQVPSYVAELERRVEAAEQMLNNQTLQQRQAQDDQLLDETLGTIKSQLSEAGLGEGVVDENLIIGSIIANNGDPDAAMKGILSFRDGSLKGFTEKKSGSKELDMPKGAPPAKERKEPRDAFAAASTAAEQMLRQSNAAEARE